ncbi:chorismate--pyruvate lyase family protein [Roseateles violae]|uniref:Probable chorismate pyruvate-lyase n=1 Tax=Roseateles violae TaxID=3058042 RepID=A0ABT8DLH7_9BURK|nr:chorismate lyase [Pelomonas sp. PFR6]MDN3919255.1 chorismate lyase [Pelomonas sp. PFR6]
MGISSRDSLRDWLRAPGSLSRRLAALGERYEVQLLRQQVSPLRHAERRALGMPRRGCTVVREVILRVDGRPLVWARSSLHQSALAGPWRALKGLGSKPLGHLLYADPRVARSELQPRRLARHGHTRRQMCKQWRAATGAPASAQMLWSRNSVFSRGGAQLRVMELFAPELAHFKARR